MSNPCQAVLRDVTNGAKAQKKKSRKIKGLIKVLPKGSKADSCRHP